MHAITTLARKDLTLLFRDKFALFWIFAFPLMYALFFGALFAGDDDGARSQIAIVVVDEAGTDESAALAERLAGHESLRVLTDENGDSLDDAKTLVRKGDCAAYVRIPPGFGGSPFRMFGGGDPNATPIEVGIDPSRATERGFLQGILMQTMFRGIADAILDKEKMTSEVDRAIGEIDNAEGLDAVQSAVLKTFLSSLRSFVGEVELETLEAGGPGQAFGDGQVSFVDVTRASGATPANSFEITFPSAIVWGLMGVAVSLAITLVRERTHGTLLRLRVAPISRAQLLAGKALGCFAMCMIVIAFLMVFATLALGVRIANLPLAVLAASAIGVCFTGLMMTVSVMGKSEPAVAGAAWGVMMPFAMVGGGMIPLIAMPPWLASVSNVSPFKWGILAMEGAVWRGFDLVDMLLPCGILVAIGAVFFGVGVAVFRRIDG
ncbi:MAG: ABC transporter permease [Planctomycetes bacterium]|nr:ABC transporter permease [Planctomycetota bacterium]